MCQAIYNVVERVAGGVSSIVKLIRSIVWELKINELKHANKLNWGFDGLKHSVFSTFIVVKTNKKVSICFLLTYTIGITVCWPVYDVVIYGTTPAGIAAALSAADAGAEDVVLLEPTYQIGGKIKLFPKQRPGVLTKIILKIRIHRNLQSNEYFVVY